jgi:hypothetical protein
VMSGGTGDADMYVKFGRAPTDTVVRLPSVQVAATPRPAHSPRRRPARTTCA